MSGPKEPKKPVNPRVRANVYGLAALYLAYLLYQIAKPYLTHDPYGPTTGQFLLGTAILGAGTAFLALMSWKMFKAPLPEGPEEAAGEETEEEDERETEEEDERETED